jgi:serine/threonine protein kinase
MLLELLKNATFVKGVCQDDLLFVTDNGKVGMCAEGSEIHKAAIRDMELKADSKKNAVSKFSFGDIITTPTLKEVYLGTITQYYTFDQGRNNGYGYYYLNYHDCTITKLAKPITYHVFDSIYGEKTKVSDFLNDYGTSRWYSYPDFKKTCPKRAIDGKLELDCSEEHFKEELIKKIYAISKDISNERKTGSATLKQLIEQQGSLRWKDALQYVVQILRGLQHAHDHGIVHRDVKPQNIMVLEDGTIKVTDFGIARFARSEQKTITDKAIGSVHYISPEQAKGELTDEKADIYSVGIVLYERIFTQSTNGRIIEECRIKEMARLVNLAIFC